MIYEEIYKTSTNKQVALSRDRKQRQNRHITCEKKRKDGGRQESQRKTLNSIYMKCLSTLLGEINNPCKATLPKEIQLEPGNTEMRGGTNLQTTHPAHKAPWLKLQDAAYLQYSTVRGADETVITIK